MAWRTRPSASAGRTWIRHARLPGPGASTDSTSGSARSAVAARSTSAGVGELELDLDDRRAIAELGGQLRDGALPDEPTGGEDPDPVAHRLDLGQQVAREHDREAAFVDELAQQVQDLDDAERVDRGRRLVEDEQVRRLDQRVGDAEPLAHAARVGLDRIVRPVGQADVGEDLVDGRLGLVDGRGR